MTKKHIFIFFLSVGFIISCLIAETFALEVQTVENKEYGFKLSIEEWFAMGDLTWKTSWKEESTTPIQGVKEGKWSISSFRSVGCSPLSQPTSLSVNPPRGKTTDRRAVCGRSARTVRRGEELGNQFFLPLSICE